MTEPSDRQTALEEFGYDLAGLRSDDAMPVAEVVDAEVERGEFTTRNKMTPDRITITFETVSGRHFAKSYKKPDDWSRVSNIVLLLEYWGLDPQELPRLDDEEEHFEVPLAGADELDWDAIERGVVDK